MESENHAESIGHDAPKEPVLVNIDTEKPENDREKTQESHQSAQEMSAPKKPSSQRHLTYRTKMRTKQRKRDMLLALEKNMGVVSHACAMAGISRDTHYRWLRTDLNYKFEVFVAGESSIDMAESVLFKQIDAGNFKAVMYYLEHKGKDRGWG